MEEIVKRFIAWLKVNYPEGYADLNPPATEQVIADLEATIGVKLPADYIACLKLVNGQAGNAGWVFDGVEFLSTDRIIDEWTVWKDLLEGGDFDGASSEPDDGVKNNWWNLKWIPITYNGAGDHFCIDMDPAQAGQPGQIITMWHDSAERELIAAKFSDWLSDYVVGLEAGQYAYSDNYGCIMPIDELE
ncbi:molybdenum cofactor biosynthesis protein MoeA [Aliikangiella marina]|uniref:Molybdenum cofactor biosynthesis protein MoeA n=1 Tax=Aliikangiella marina TaxID=1712262 RepID=A0A545TEI2_9GAMM|nr:SMI1/KNR4 family protein [Aliikangiella marina]TQV75581.1 molybdenum cofactor biosynthesis protein MoeA [Aliikangiella marina]